ncbi:MAG: hydroxymethylglutaryl-CoA lyase [Meiothermus sp.]|uniref:hydroxymethylglutaryl-CoA lyase n=1 Tax=Meiothermus sp. TaxID=1955249 RepID=UPI0025D29624|nr:hydroxymethylglutaryl-CoA lyase [Meiothermus sp.]MCS7194091.1 hydroxymethylglutaryl-CoA lyase [Meiothermus sp.]MDW8089958.1 hydroxymethylglutaryl-CoA lyase [Meiothermus sp.]
MKWVECPRDSWQGYSRFIPTEEKVAYLRGLLEAGFRNLDLTSFVSPKWVPQHADAEAVLAALPPPEGREYLAVVGNLRGLERALQVPHLTSVGYPFSISETFQRRNLNMGLEDSWRTLREMVREARGKRFVVYLSMAFGNPYGDPWTPGLTAQFVGRMRELEGIAGLALADTYGVASAQIISETLEAVAGLNGNLQGLGLHLHSRPEDTLEKVRAALQAGVQWLEGALGGIGGCPFAGDERVGNLATERVLPYLEQQGHGVGVALEGLAELAGRAHLLRTKYA